MTASSRVAAGHSSGYSLARGLEHAAPLLDSRPEQQPVGTGQIFVGHPHATGVHDADTRELAFELRVRMATDDEIGVDIREERGDALDRRALGEDVDVAARRGVHEEHPPHSRDLQRHRRWQRVQERDLLAAELRANPLEDRVRRRPVLARRQLAVGVAAEPVDASAQPPQQLERLPRKRPGDDVAAGDDRRVVRQVGEHRLERGQVAVHVVQRRYPRQRRPSV